MLSDIFLVFGRTSVFYSSCATLLT